MMEFDNRWTMAEDTLKQAFDRMEIDNKYYPLFVERATQAVNDIALAFEPEQDDIIASLDIATEYMNIYVGQIEAGLSETWAEAYANHSLNENVDDSAMAAFMAVSNLQGRAQADKDLALFAHFLSDYPRFVENYTIIFLNGGTIKDTNDFLKLYDSLVEEGKSELYAKQYALHHLDTPDDDYCHLYASKYEGCINKGIESYKATTIAEAYEDFFQKRFPIDDPKDFEFIDVYIQGFEYAIVNGIDPPEKFAKEYQAAYYNNGERPSYVANGEYDDIISNLLANIE